MGNRGLELSLEEVLRGTRGKVVKNRHGEELMRSDAIGGDEVQVTLDIELQARVEAILSSSLGLMVSQTWHRNAKMPDGMPLRGAVVVLDIDRSEVLAMASSPSLHAEEDQEGYPWLNRAAEGFYPPGSIIKPLVLVSAMTDGHLRPDEGVQCTGHYFDSVKNAARCWIYRKKNNYATHNKLEAAEALARSCNIFFYELGLRLGFETLLEWYKKFGLGHPLSEQLTRPSATGEHGHVPDDQAVQTLKKQGALAFETVSIAIGQGAITWSPLHAAAAYATLARGGLWITPTILATRLATGTAQQEVDLGLDQKSVQLALEGLHQSVTKRYGTGAILRHAATSNEYIFNVDGVRIWGKTGTAEAPPFYFSKDEDPIKDLDHSWFVVMASEINNTKPSVVIVVLVEHGGSGGRVAGPIANQVLHAIVAEGYIAQ